MSHDTRVLFVVIAAGQLAAGCTYAVRSTPYHSGTVPPAGVVYSLPKALFQLKVQYTVVDEEKTVLGWPQPVFHSCYVTGVAPSLVLVADTSATFVLQGDAIADAGLLESEMAFRLDESGQVLSGVDVSAKDKTVETVAAAVGALVQVGKVAAAAGRAVPDAVSPIEKRLYLTYEKIRDSKVPDEVQKLTAEARLLMDLITAHAAASKVTMTTRNYEQVVTLDPDECLAGCTVPEPAIPNAGTPPQLTLTVAPVAQGQAATFPAGEVTGVLYRSPVPCKVTVEQSSGEQLYQGYWPFPQYGRLARLDIKSKSTTSRKIGLEMSAQTGGLKEYKVEAGSSADKIAGQIGQSLQQVHDTLNQIRFEAPLQALKNEKESLEMQVEIEKLRKDLEDLKKNGKR